MKYTSSAELSKTATYLYLDKGETSSNATGFFLAFNDDPTVFLVTNKHVLTGAKTLSVPILPDREHRAPCADLSLGDNVFYHPSEAIDLAIVKVDHEAIYFSQNSSSSGPLSLCPNCLREEMILSPEELQALDYCEEVLVFGAPNGLYDVRSQLLIAYHGMTATPAYSSFIRPDSFLVDIPIFHGSSGSPVFWCTPESMASYENTRLLGIMNAAQIKPGTKDDPVFMRLGGAIPAYKLLDFKPLIRQRALNRNS